MRYHAASKAEEKWRLLSLRILPARLYSEEAGWLLGFNADEIGLLVHHRLLKPLGNPAPNGKKLFATVEIQSLAQDLDWLDRATRTIIQHWKTKNSGGSANNMVS
jgi:hypothetical protein